MRMKKSEKEFLKMIGYSLGLCGVSGLALIGASNILTLPLAGVVTYKASKHGVNLVKEEQREVQNHYHVITFNDFINK